MTRLGLALGSGGARGLAHVGVLSVLESAGLAPACIAGTSMGAIIGALYAECADSRMLGERLLAYTGNPEFLACWEPFIERDALSNRRSFFSELRRSIVRGVLTFKTLSTPAQRSAETLMVPLRRLYRAENIEDLRLPFACVAVDLLGGEPHVFSRGSLVTAIYASSAMPGVFPPLAWEDKLLVDGGGPYRVPVGVCSDLGADFILAVDIPSFWPEKDEFKTGVDVLMRSDAIARNRLNRLTLEMADLVVTPAVAGFHWADFGAAEKICEAGASAMTAALPALERILHERESAAARFKRSLRQLFSRNER